MWWKRHYMSAAAAVGLSFNGARQSNAITVDRLVTRGLEAQQQRVVLPLIAASMPYKTA
jgi:hypothetical protein